MRLPRFRIRTLMIAVGVIATLCAAWAAIETRCERSRWATVRVINHRSAPLSRVRVVFPEGQRELPRLPPGQEADFPVRIKDEARISVEIDGHCYAEWFSVRGGSKPALTVSE